MIELLTIAALLALCVAAGMLGRLVERRQNAAKTECVECAHQTRPGQLVAALAAAQEHKSATGHPTMVVKA